MKAFPIIDYVNGENSHIYQEKGMDLRDYFAARAMQAIIQNSDQKSIAVNNIDLWIGDYAYTVADAMMKAREQ